MYCERRVQLLFCNKSVLNSFSVILWLRVVQERTVVSD